MSKDSKERERLSALVDNLSRADDVKLNRRAFIKSTFGAGIALGLATVPFNIATFVRSEPRTDRQNRPSVHHDGRGARAREITRI